MNPQALSGLEKAALVILSLEESVAAALLTNLDDGELRRLAKAIDQLDEVPPDAIIPALEDFERCLHTPAIHKGPGYLRKLAGQALGEARASRMFSPPPELTPHALESIKAARTTTLADLLQEEHPQIAAVILTQLPPPQVSKVLRLMPAPLQSDLLARIASVEEIPSRALAVASEALLKALSAAGGLASPEERAQYDGVAFSASVLNEMPTEASEQLLERIGDAARDTANKIREAMFTFEDLGRLDKRALQPLMREISSETLLVALHTASESLREHFLSAVSSRAGQTIRDDLAALPPKRLSEVEAAQRELVETTMRLAGEGKLTLPPRGEDAK